MVSDLSFEKGMARKLAMARRDRAQSQFASQRACDMLVDFLYGSEGRAISGYMPIRSELDALPAMTALARYNELCVPVILGQHKPLIFHRWSPNAAMVEGPYGAQVPAFPRELVPEVVILPLLAFNKAGHRLGYGGGYYDRTLEKLRAAGTVQAIGLAFAGQETDDLPVEETDQPLDMVITEERVMIF